MGQGYRVGQIYKDDLKSFQSRRKIADMKENSENHSVLWFSAKDLEHLSSEKEAIGAGFGQADETRSTRIMGTR